MTLEERIEAAARALCEADDYDRSDDYYRWMAEVFFQHIGVSSSPPTHWIAPMEATEEMMRRAETSPIAWREARDAYLNREGK